MTFTNDPPLDLGAEAESERHVRLIHDLRLAYQPAPALSSADTAMHHILHDRRRSPGRASAKGRARLLALRLTGLVTALALLAGGFTYLHTQTPGVVSAQTVIQRAVTAGISATTVSHAVYRLTASDGRRGIGDVWLEADASGAPVGFALTQSTATSADSALKLAYRTVQTGGLVQTYDPTGNVIRTYAASGADSQRATMFDAPFIAMHLRQLAAQHGAHVVGQRTLDGVPVTVLRTGSGIHADTFFVDQHTYILRGVNWTAHGVAWRARLVSHATVPLSTVPATAFRLQAPADATVAAPEQGTGFDLLSLMADACHSTSQAVLDDMRAHPDSTGLEICQDTNPGITSDELVAALSPSPEVAIKMSYFVSHPVRYLRILAQ